MTSAQIDTAVEWLKETTFASFQESGTGGYPPLVARVESHVVIAGLDHDGKPELEVYCGDTVVTWREAAIGSLELSPDWADRMAEAMEETRPEECQCDVGAGGS